MYAFAPPDVVGLMGDAGSPAVSGPAEEIRTIFVCGFPPGVYDRELFNLLRFLPGFEASQMNAKQPSTTSPMGFALFSSAAAALSAVQVVRDLEFDNGVTLRCEMAHKNMYLKDDPSIRRVDGRGPTLSPAQGSGTVLTAISPYGAAASGAIPYAAAAPQYGASVAVPGTTYGPILGSALAAQRPAVTVHHHHAAANGGSAGGAGLLPPPGQAAAMAGQYAGLVNTAAVTGYGPVTNRNDNPPCNTLFIGNLSDGVDENELTAVFSRQPGYVQLKLIRQDRNVACFVEFVDKATAAAVHASLQGLLLESSTRGPIRIQYSKNPYGKRTQYGGGHAAAAAGYSAAALFGAGGANGGVGIMNPSMATALMAASGGDFTSWSPGFVIAGNGLPATNGVH